MIDMNIRFFRKNMSMTQEQLAEELSVSRQTVAKWENGEVIPNISDCMRMAEIFQVTMDQVQWLLLPCLRCLTKQEVIPHLRLLHYASQLVALSIFDSFNICYWWLILAFFDP